MKKIRIKEFSQRITIFVRTETGRDSEDYPVYTDNDLFSTWAKAETDGVEETETNKAAFDASRMVFTIRFRRVALDNRLFIRHNGLEYAVVGIDPCDFDRAYIKIHAKRVVLQNGFISF